jgi:geranylgeranyl pyrophosphate synthase
LLERGGTAPRALIERIMTEHTVTREQWAELKHMLAEHQATAAALRQAQHYGSLAQQHLAILAPSPERDALMALAEYILSRDR